MMKRAEMGIGTLIIFIAMILVAAIAAGVLIETATSLQNKALLTGERSKGQVSTALRPMLVTAMDGSTGNNVDKFYIKLKLAPGSDPIRFSDMLTEVSLKNISSDLLYDSDKNCRQVGNSNGTYYYIDYLVTGDNYDSGYLQRGDVVEICFETERNVSEDETLNIALIPKIGNPTIIETALPDIVTEKKVKIWLS